VRASVGVKAVRRILGISRSRRIVQRQFVGSRDSLVVKRFPDLLPVAGFAPDGENALNNRDDEARGWAMAKEPRTITIDPDSELGRALDQTAGEPIVLLRNGTRFRVTRDQDDPWANYDPEAVRAALRAVAGTLTPDEGERLKELIYRGREEGTRPLDRP
jgi:hypothetical protein